MAVCSQSLHVLLCVPVSEVPVSSASSLTSLSPPSPPQDELLPAVLPPSAELDETAACQDGRGLTFTAPEALVDPSYSHPLRIFVSSPTHPSARRGFQDTVLSRIAWIQWFYP